MAKIPIEINLDLSDPNNTYLRSIFNKLKSKQYIPLSKAIITGTLDIKSPPTFNYNLKVTYIDLYYKSNNNTNNSNNNNNNKESHSL